MFLPLLPHIQITKPWIQNVTLAEQERFKTPANCLLGNELGEFNTWKFVELALAPGCHEEDEINECTDDALAVIEVALIPLIKFNMFGAITCDNDKKGAPDGYYLVRFTDIPFVLQEPRPVEGCNGGDMPEGTTVVEGRYWNRVPRSPHWFQEGKWDAPKLLFRVQYVLHPNIEMEAYHQRDGNLPATNSLIEEQRRRAPTTCKKVPDIVVEDINLEKKRRNELDHVEVEFEDDTSNDVNDDDDEEEEEEEEE
jgi:hypothetical protein